jgi:hypothetical protein
MNKALLEQISSICIRKTQNQVYFCSIGNGENNKRIGALKIRILPSITSYMRSRAITTVIISRWSFMAYAFTSSAKS